MYFVLAFLNFAEENPQTLKLVSIVGKQILSIQLSNTSFCNKCHAESASDSQENMIATVG